MHIKTQIDFRLYSPNDKYSINEPFENICTRKKTLGGAHIKCAVNLLKLIRITTIYCMKLCSLRERLRTHKDFTKDLCFFI